MTNDTKPTIPDVLEQFRAYYAKHPATWGSLHIVLDDGNVRDSDVQWSLKYAERSGDLEGVALARILLQMSQAQRRRLPRKVKEVP